MAAAFREAGIQTAALDARLLVCAACGLSHEQFVAEPARSVSGREEALIAHYGARRLAGEPVSRLLGVREFWGLTFELGPDTLDPRADTETLVRAALELCREGTGGAAPRLLDLGTGSGCILISLLHELPGASGVGVDRAAGAVRVARHNARRLGVADRAAFHCGSWGEALSARFDLLLCNPPYVATGEIAGLDAGVARHDPRAALDGGGDGLACHRQIAPRLVRLLAPGGSGASPRGSPGRPRTGKKGLAIFRDRARFSPPNLFAATRTGWRKQANISEEAYAAARSNADCAALRGGVSRTLAQLTAGTGMGGAASVWG